MSTFNCCLLNGPLKKYRNEPAFMKALEEISVKNTKQMQQVCKPLYKKSEKKRKRRKKERKQNSSD